MIDNHDLTTAAYCPDCQMTHEIVDQFEDEDRTGTRVHVTLLSCGHALTRDVR